MTEATSTLTRAEWATAFEHDEVSIYEIVGRKVGMRASALPWLGATD